MALTDAIVRNSKPQHKAYTLKDIEGLSLFIAPTGNKSWHFRYSTQGKRNRISFGQYPEITLKEARQRCEDARFLIKNGQSPHQSQLINLSDLASTSTLGIKTPIQVETFAQFSERWKAFKFRKLGLENYTRRQSTHIQIERYMRIDMLPGLGKIPMNQITKQDVLKVLRKIEMRGALSIAEKVRVWLNEIFSHAEAEGLIEHNPATGMHILALPKNPTLNNPYLTIEELPEFLVKLDHYQGDRQTKLGIQLLLLTGVRTGELRQARPEDFDLDSQLWTIPPEHVKQLRKLVTVSKKKVPPYVVPLSTQAVDIIQQLLSMKYPHQPYLLGHTYDPRLPISENTLNCGIRRLGYKGRLTGHGLRATLSTALNEMEYPKQWIEAQLSHSDKDQISGTYNHAKYISQRKQMMQDWADKIEQWKEQEMSHGATIN